MTTFANNEDGAVTVDWVVLTAALVGLGLAAMAVVQSGTEDLSTDIKDQLENTVIKTAFVETFTSYTGATGGTYQTTASPASQRSANCPGNALPDMSQTLTSQGCTINHVGRTFTHTAGDGTTYQTFVGDYYANGEYDNTQFHYFSGSGFSRTPITGSEIPAELLALEASHQQFDPTEMYPAGV